MAIQPTAVFEVRTTGNILNGAGYDAGISGAGTDYTQQDSAQLALTDLACANNTTLTSVTGGFTSAMIGNSVYISSGTNFTPGFYFITAVASTNSVTVDRNPTTGGAAVSGVGRVGGGRTTLESPLCDSLGVGNIIYVKKGAYSFATLTTNDGTTGNPIVVEGYNATRGDYPTGTNRPAFTMSGTFIAGISNFLKNLEFIGSFSGTLVTLTAANAYSCIVNCKATNTGAGAVTTWNMGDQSSAFSCEGVSTNGYAFNGMRGIFENCYVHDSLCGFLISGSRCSIVNSVVDTCTTGILDSGAFYNLSIVNSVIYNCTSGITLAGALATRVVNSIISACTTGVTAAAPESYSGFFDYNIWNNTTDFSSYTNKGTHDLTTDPLLTNPANGDFTLQASSPAVNLGNKISVAGAAGTYKFNAGVDQKSAGGGAGQSSFVG